MAHGKQVNIHAPRSRSYQGPFGRICPDLPGWVPPGLTPGKDEQEIANQMLNIANNDMVEAPGKTPAEIASDNNLIAELEANFSSTTIPAGYTYFGQFVDHDITFDPVSSLMRANDPEKLLNHRTPRLDLDNVYGRGPDDQPYLYGRNGDKPKLVVGETPGTNVSDLPRNANGTAIIGDMRNDENSMVSQLQTAFLRAHNTLVDQAGGDFEKARTSLRWLYQWIVWNDFVKRITIADIQSCALEKKTLCGGREGWQLGLRDVYSWQTSPFMPVEFSVAAYRFGHSLVRNSYQTNNTHRGFNNFAPIFDNTSAAIPDDLRGFRVMDKKNVIQWDWFLQHQSSSGPFPQMARKIDTKLSNALTALHEGPPGSSMNILAFRNLLRGYQMGLPSGTAMAKKYCLDPIDIDPTKDALWFYILKEAEDQATGETLGQLGSTIVCAVFAGLLKGDPSSYINLQPCWTPDDDPLIAGFFGQPGVIKDNPEWDLTTIIRLAGMPVEGGDIT
jgi:hypothetical protein